MIAAQHDRSQCHDAPDAVATHRRFMPEALAIIDCATGTNWTWRMLDAAVDRLAAWMVDITGRPASGARFATLCRNQIEMLLLHLACVRADAIFAPLNWRLADAEVAEAAVIGVPDARWGGAYVAPVAGATVTQATLAAHCAARLARFKVPHSFVVAHDIPRTASGKVQKHRFRVRVASAMDHHPGVPDASR